MIAVGEEIVRLAVGDYFEIIYTKMMLAVAKRELKIARISLRLSKREG